jgi:hypothetical protein
METTLAAKLKLVTTPAQFQALRQTQLAYRDALNLTSLHAFAQGKTSNSKRLHRDLYERVRGECALPSQMACSVFRQVGATYKALWTKARKANRHASRWAFAELHGMLAYKAALASLVCIKLDADYTSQACPKCGFTSKANRPNKGLLFICQQCHYMLHADLVGARNISLRALVIRQDWMATGQLSGAPDGTDREAKAARLQRYAELRWSPVPSLLPSGAGD